VALALDNRRLLGSSDEGGPFLPLRKGATLTMRGPGSGVVMSDLLQEPGAKNHLVTASVVFGAVGTMLGALAWVAVVNYTSGPIFIAQSSGPAALVMGCIALAKAGTLQHDRLGFLLGAAAVLLAIVGTVFFMWAVTQGDGANVSHVGRLGDVPLP
jgi:hypothetical protein